jgi:hypothetical protein
MILQGMGPSAVLSVWKLDSQPDCLHKTRCLFEWTVEGDRMFLAEQFHWEEHHDTRGLMQESTITVRRIERVLHLDNLYPEAHISTFKQLPHSQSFLRLLERSQGGGGDDGHHHHTIMVHPEDHNEQEGQDTGGDSTPTSSAASTASISTAATTTATAAAVLSSRGAPPIGLSTTPAVLEPSSPVLSLAFQLLPNRRIPETILTDRALRHVRQLDLTGTSFTCGEQLSLFDALHTVVLDHNALNGLQGYGLRRNENLETLWFNHNDVTDLVSFVDTLKVLYPNLSYLSLMCNPVSPALLDFDAGRSMSHFRLYLLQQVTSLKIIDGKAVSREETFEADRRGVILFAGGGRSDTAARMDVERREEFPAAPTSASPPAPMPPFSSSSSPFSSSKNPNPSLSEKEGAGGASGKDPNAGPDTTKGRHDAGWAAPPEKTITLALAAAVELEHVVSLAVLFIIAALLYVLYLWQGSGGLDGAALGNL